MNNRHEPVYSKKSGRFQVSVWKNKKVIRSARYHDTYFVNDNRRCIQFNRYNQHAGMWDQQKIFCREKDVFNLAQLIGPLCGIESSRASKKVFDRLKYDQSLDFFIDN